MKGKKLTIREVRNFVENNNGVLLSSEYKNSGSKLHIRCNIDHYEWHPTWDNLKQGSWCPKCSNCAKPTIKEIRCFVENKNGKLLSNSYKNNHTRLLVQCNIDNRKWNTTWMVLRDGSWCARCSKKEKRTIEEIRCLIANKNGTLLDKVYKDAHTKLHIYCKKCKNSWHISWTKLQQNRWCPKCSSGKTQRKLQKILEEILGQKSCANHTDFKWLKGPGGGQQEIDIYFPNLKLAVEYDGEHHFKPIKFGNYDTKERLKYIKRLDNNKNKLIGKHPEDVEYFIRFNYKEEITREYVLQKLIEVKII